MDATWDWTRFVAALARDPSLCTRMAGVLAEHNLHWEVEVGAQGHGGWTAQVTAAPNGEAQWTSGGDAPQTIPWTEFVARVQALPADQWCNLMVCQSLPRRQAIALRVGLADHVAKVWYTLLPLYMAGVSSHS